MKLEEGFYEGEMSNNEMNGKGKLLDNNHWILYEGNFSKNEFEGFGILYN